MNWQEIAFLLLGLALLFTAFVYGVLCVIEKALKLRKELKEMPSMIRSR